MSSVDRTLKYTLLYSTTSSSRPCHTRLISVSAVSMASSLLAEADRSPMKSAYLGKPYATTLSSVKSAEVGSKVTPTSFISARQCRSRSAGLPSAWMRGMVAWKSRILPSSACHTPCFFSSRSLVSRCRYLPAASSMPTTSRTEKEPVFHRCQSASQLSATLHMPSSSSISFSVSDSCAASGWGKVWLHCVLCGTRRLGAAGEHECERERRQWRMALLQGRHVLS